MRKLAILALALLGGCAQVKSGLCWVDKQIPACEWAGEDEAAPKVNDPVPGGK